MKKACLLLALMVLVIWLVHAAPVRERTNPAGNESSVRETVSSVRETVSSTGCDGSQSCCVNQGETDPHWECMDGACYCVSGCGASVNCASCGCNQDDEWACLNNGGNWDSSTCTCTYGCDPDGSQEASCREMGGTWDPASCSCQPPPCNPGPPQETDRQYAGSWQECDGGYLYDCDGYYVTYTQYCQDGQTVYNQWTEFNPVCVSDYTPCGGGGGGGGGCYDDPSCSCDYDYGYCCDYDYCWEF